MIIRFFYVLFTIFFSSQFGKLTQTLYNLDNDFLAIFFNVFQSCNSMIFLLLLYILLLLNFRMNLCLLSPRRDIIFNKKKIFIEDRNRRMNIFSNRIKRKIITLFTRQYTHTHRRRCQLIIRGFSNFHSPRWEKIDGDGTDFLIDDHLNFDSTVARQFEKAFQIRRMIQWKYSSITHVL